MFSNEQYTLIFVGGGWYEEGMVWCDVEGRCRDINQFTDMLKSIFGHIKIILAVISGCYGPEGSLKYQLFPYMFNVWTNNICCRPSRWQCQCSRLRSYQWTAGMPSASRSSSSQPLGELRPLSLSSGCWQSCSVRTF